MKEKLEALREQALHELESLRVPKDLEEFRIRVMGKKGTLTEVLLRAGQPACRRTPEGRSAGQPAAQRAGNSTGQAGSGNSGQRSRPNGCGRKRST